MRRDAFFEFRAVNMVHLVEPQHLFVPALLDVFSEAGIHVDYATNSVEPRRLLDDAPDIVFIDTDFLDEPLEAVRITHVLVPNARVIVYSSAHSDVIIRAFQAAGAHRVLDKSADRPQIVRDLRSVLQERRRHA